jgi:hypothetical protein
MSLPFALGTDTVENLKTTLVGLYRPAQVIRDAIEADLASIGVDEEIPIDKIVDQMIQILILEEI